MYANVIRQSSSTGSFTPVLSSVRALPDHINVHTARNSLECLSLGHIFTSIVRIVRIVLNETTL